MDSLNSRPADRPAALNLLDRAAAAQPHLRSQATRVLHLLLLLAVLHQLIGSQFLTRPFPGEPASWTYDLHQYVGLASLAVVTAFWTWTLVRQGETRLGRLLPWFSAKRRRAVTANAMAQLRRLAAGHVPDDADGALASAVHGLGLMAVTAMAVSGAMFFIAEGSSLAHGAMTAHKLVAKAMWAYLVGHAGLALLHHLLGSDIFSRMFWGRGARPGDSQPPRRPPI